MYVLRALMERCSNFAEEKSSVEHLSHQLSLKGEHNLEMLTSLKYHCELAGEGVEYCLGLANFRYRSIPLNRKIKKSIREMCYIMHVKEKSVNKFSGKCHRYKLTHQKDKDDTQMTYKNIEKWKENPIMILSL